MQVKREKSRRHGTALVEAALVLLILFMITFGAIEYGWMFLKEEQVTNAAREGARTGAPPDATTAGAKAVIDSIMSSGGMSASGYTVTFTPTDISTVAPGQIFSVKVSVPYANVAITKVKATLVPVPTNISATVSMAKEGP